LLFAVLIMSPAVMTCAAPLPTIAGPAEPRPATLLFRSHLESGVVLNDPYTDGSEIWWQDLLGADSSGFAWPLSVWGYDGILQMIVDARKPIDDYLVNELVTLPGRDGQPTRALHQVLKQMDYPWTQDPYYIETDGHEESDLYLRYDLRLPADLAVRLGTDGWLALCEWKTTADYRMAAYVYQDQVGALYWYIHGDNVVRDVPYVEYWYRENRQVPVPAGEWFTMELFWHRGSGNDGRVWWAIDGQVVADFHGRTKIRNPINNLMIFTLYTESAPMEMWVDNIEVWDGFPCGEGQSCFPGGE
jgi:hypothetical protein